MQLIQRRNVLALGGLAGFLCVAVAVNAQSDRAPAAKNSQPVARTITAKERIAVRGGGSEKFYITSWLQPGAKVHVLGPSKKYPGWLEINPPPGSFSWISSLLVKRYSKFIAAVVADNPVPTRIGSQIEPPTRKMPNVQNRRRLSRGTLVIVLDHNAAAASDGNWLPIAPTPGEVRYIPAAAVAGSVAEQVSPPQRKLGSPRYLIASADRAFKNRQWCRATYFYSEALPRANYKQQLYCYNQLSELEKVGGGPTKCLQQPGHPRHVSTQQSTIFHTAARHRVVKPPKIKQKTHTAFSPSPARWSRWGTLRRTRFRHDNGKPMFVLVDRKGSVITYAVTTPNLTLEPYVDRSLCLFGTRQYRSDSYFRNYFVLVSHVAVP